MNNPPRLVSLDQFRRKRPARIAQIEDTQPAPEAATTSSALAAPEQAPPALNPRTQRRLEAAMRAIEKLKAAEFDAINEAAAPKQYRIRFSAAAVAREAGIGRTQLYEGHSGIQQAIEAARAELEAALEQRRSVKRPISKRGLEERIATLEAQHEAVLSRLASQRLSDLIRRMGPVLDAAQRAGNSGAEAQARIRRLEQQLEAQVAANQILFSAMSDKSKE